MLHRYLTFLFLTLPLLSTASPHPYEISESDPDPNGHGTLDTLIPRSPHSYEISESDPDPEGLGTLDTILPRAPGDPQHPANGRATIYLYHATCIENVEGVAYFPGIPQRRGDFTYRGGFYLTSNFRQARNFAVCYLSSTCRDGLAVVRYRWNGRNPTQADVNAGYPNVPPDVLNLDTLPRAASGERATKEFWDNMNQIYLYRLSNLPLPANLQTSKNAHDNVHMITGTLPLNTEQLNCGMKQSDGDFSQYVIVDTNAAPYLRYDCHYKLNSDGAVYEICNPRSDQPVRIFPGLPNFP